jgi:ElaB/YqjD/DUF883 family membrane-anchored ribosome-binding protein
MSMDTDRIEADLDQSRTRLNDTLQALGSKLSPGQMLDEVLGLAQGQAGQFAGKLGRQVRDNPMPTLLIGAGVAMLLLNARHGGGGVNGDDWHAERRYRSLEETRWANPRRADESDDNYDARLYDAYGHALDLKQRAGEAAHDFTARIAKTVDGVRDTAHAARERVGQSLSSTASYVSDKAHNLGERAADMRHGAGDLYRDSPLSVGAIALAIGAVIGSLTPLTDTERERLEGIADKAARAGADLAERGAAMVEDKAGAVH